MTIELFRQDSYLQTCEAKVTGHKDNAILLDQTVFYPTGGGQPCDFGNLILEDGHEIKIIGCEKDNETGDILHIVEEGTALSAIGTAVTCQIDWERRYTFMRMHSLLHLLCAKVDGEITGCSIGLEKSRVDFNLPEPPDKEALSKAVNDEIINAPIIEIGQISDEDLDANPDLIRTMSVKPPRGQGSVRTIRIGDIDYQPCGGTHVKSLDEIGPVRIGKVEKKGKLNRRINVHFAD
jgi:misacylated tRNA(Ala) deacylase